jgi:hypothetical protein
MGIGSEVEVLGTHTKIEKIQLVVTVTPVEGADPELREIVIEVPRQNFENPYKGRK